MLKTSKELIFKKMYTKQNSRFFFDNEVNHYEINKRI